MNYSNIRLSIITVFFFSALISCNKDDNDGGTTTPAPTGTLEGTYTSGTGMTSTWTATSVTAQHDTIENLLRFTARNSANEIITFLINDTASGPAAVYEFNSNPVEVNESTFKKPGIDNVATTRRNDTITAASGSLFLSTNDRVANTFSGSIPAVAWYYVTDSSEVFAGALQNAVFENVPVTRNSGESIGSTSVSATIDGSAFNAQVSISLADDDFIQIVATASNGHSIDITVDKSAAVGTYDMSGSSEEVLITYNVIENGESVAYFMNSGTVQLSAINADENTVSGAFSGSAESTSQSNTVVITNGSFSVE